MEVINKYNMRNTEDRLQDFRATISEIVDVNMHNKVPRDKQELDPDIYGKRLETSPDKHLKYEEASKSTQGFSTKHSNMK